MTFRRDNSVQYIVTFNTTIPWKTSTISKSSHLLTKTTQRYYPLSIQGWFWLCFKYLTMRNKLLPVVGKGLKSGTRDLISNEGSEKQGSQIF